MHTYFAFVLVLHDTISQIAILDEIFNNQSILVDAADVRTPEPVVQADCLTDAFVVVEMFAVAIAKGLKKGNLGHVRLNEDVR